MHISQKVRVDKKVRGFLVRAYSMIEQLFGVPESTLYAVRLVVTFEDGTQFQAEEPFAVNVYGWQIRSFTVDVDSSTTVREVEIFCILRATRGAVYFDDILISPIPS